MMIARPARMSFLTWFLPKLALQDLTSQTVALAAPSTEAADQVARGPVVSLIIARPARMSLM